VESLEDGSLVDREESTSTSESSNGCLSPQVMLFLVVIEGAPYNRRGWCLLLFIVVENTGTKLATEYCNL
jgi:hypothetical protein